MNLKEVEEKLKRVSDIYAEKFKIKRDHDELQKNFRDEVAGVIAMTMLFADHKGIDVEQALKEKWFKYL